MEKTFRNKYFQYYQEYYFSAKIDIPLLEDFAAEVLKSGYLLLYSSAVSLLCKLANETRAVDRFQGYLNQLKEVGEEKGGYPKVHYHINEGLYLMDVKNKLDDAITELQAALKVFQDNKLDNPLTIFTINQFMGGAYARLGDDLAAYPCFTNALKANLNEIFKFHKGATYVQMAIIERKFHLTTQALQKNLKSLEIHRKYKIDRNLCVNLIKIGVVYTELSRYDEALSAFTEGLELAEKLNNILAISETLYSMGMLYSAKGEYQTAIEYYNKSIEVHSTPIITCYTLNNLGNAYNNCGLHEEAEQKYLKGIEIAKEIKDDFILLKLYSNFGLDCIRQEKYDQALEYLKLAEPLAIKINEVDVQKIIYLSYTELYTGLKNYELKSEYSMLYAEKLKEYYEIKLKNNVDFMKMIVES